MKRTYLIIALFGTLAYACQPPADPAIAPVEELTTESSVSVQSGFCGCIFETVCFFTVTPGRIPLTSPGPCKPNPNNNCFIAKNVCLPIIFNCFLCPPPEWINPWEFYQEIDPRVFYSIKDRVHMDVGPNQFSPFPVNEQVMGLQYYEEFPGMRSRERMTFHSNMELDEETVRNYRLGGNVIPAGSYPVIHNPENGTYNVLVSVASFPIRSRVPVLFAPTLPGRTGSLKKLLDAPFEESADIIVVNGSTGFTLDGARREGTYLFSPNSESLGVMVIGASPKPYPIITIDSPFELNEGIARSLGIESFLLTVPELEQESDPRRGLQTAFIHTPE